MTQQDVAAAVGRLTDPMERRIAEALVSAGVTFRIDGQADTKGLDFHIPDAARSGPGVYIEVKRFHSDRIAGQMARANDVIAVQGEGAVNWLCSVLSALQQRSGAVERELVIAGFLAGADEALARISKAAQAGDAAGMALALRIEAGLYADAILGGQSCP